MPLVGEVAEKSKFFMVHICRELFKINMYRDFEYFLV
jgi:hypothetical protein